MVSNSRRAAAAIAEARASPAWRVPSAGSATVTLNAIAEPLAQRDRERQAGKAAAADQHIGAPGNVLGALCLRHGGSISLRRQ